MVKKEHLIIAVVAAAVLGFFIGRLTGPHGGLPAGWSSRGGEEQEEEAGALVAAVGAGAAGQESKVVPVGGGSRRGPATAKVTIVEFSDFQCPFSKRAAGTLDEVIAAHSKDVRHVYRHNPLGFHKDALLAAEASLAAGAQGRFWEMKAKLFTDTKALKRKDLLRYAEELELDIERFERDLEQHTYRARVEEDQKAATRLGVRGTPGFFVNGVRVAGAQPAAKFNEIIASEVAAVDGLLEAGAPLSVVYAKRVDANYKPAAPSKGRAAQADADAVYQVPVGSSAVKGPADALVTVVTFSEFQCPYCSRFAPSLDSLLEAYPGDVRIVFKHNPLSFHKQAPGAAEAALAAHAQGKFWEMHDRLFRNNKALRRADLEEHAEAIGLDMSRFRAELDQHTWRQAIQADQALASRLGAQGTPHSFINGRRVKGAKPLAALRSEVDRALKEARALVAKGVPRGDVYARLTAKGLDRAAAGPKRDRQRRRRKLDPSVVFHVPMPEGEAYAKGPKDALITVMEFSDFQCPYCKRAAATMEELLKAYPNELRVIFRHNPLSFHKQAKGAAQATLAAAEQGRFWEMHDMLFANQKALGAEALEGYARQLQLDVKRFGDFMKTERGAARIETDQALAGRLGARGTPAFFVNGRLVQGARPAAGFKEVIEEELVRARALLAAGTPRSELYGRLIADGARRAVYLPAPDDDGSAAAPVEGGGPAEAPKRQEIGLGDAPRRGPAKPEVDIVIFSDFQCPHCSKMVEVLDRISREYPKRVRVAFKQSPLSFHKDAARAAQASLAAHEQGKFWEMHDMLFRNQRNLSMKAIEGYAGELGLDMVKFADAMRSGRHQEQVERDRRQAKEVGATGTPALFINGRMLRGAVSYDKLQKVVEAEIQRKRLGGTRLRSGSLLRNPMLRKVDIQRLRERAGRGKR